MTDPAGPTAQQIAARLKISEAQADRGEGVPMAEVSRRLREKIGRIEQPDKRVAAAVKP